MFNILLLLLYIFGQCINQSHALYVRMLDNPINLKYTKCCFSESLRLIGYVLKIHHNSLIVCTFFNFVFNHFTVALLTQESCLFAGELPFLSVMIG